MSVHGKQADRILELLVRRAYQQGDWQWCELPQIMALGIASHTRRISDLRKRGYNIECRSEWIDGQRHTSYRLVKP